MYLKYFLLWLPMIVLAVGNGTLRQFVLLPHMNELKAHQLSTIILILLCAVYITFIYPVLSLQNSSQAIWLGALWILLTILFEFTLGRLAGRSWAYLLNDYNLLTGHIWLIFLLFLLLFPYALFIVKQ